MIIVFEGTDKTGKTTLIKWLNKYYQHKHHFIDRAYISSYVYNELYSRDEDVKDECANNFKKLDAIVDLVFLCQAEDAEIRKRLLDNGEEPHTINHINYEQAMFAKVAQVMGIKQIVTINTTNLSNACLDIIKIISLFEENKDKKVYDSRYFNKVEQCNNIVIKSTDVLYSAKLRREYDWYVGIKGISRQYIPSHVELLQDKNQYGNVAYHLYMDKCGIFPMSELYKSNLTFDFWLLHINKLFEMVSDFSLYKVEEKDVSKKNPYTTKINDRLLTVKECIKSKALQDILFGNQQLVVNGKKIYNFSDKDFARFNHAMLIDLDASYKRNCYFPYHGDLHLGNILNSYKAIDPNGDVQGDIRYDIAKLRHSFHGLYDYILCNDYTLDYDGGNYNISIKGPTNYDLIMYAFDRKLVELGYDLEEIKLIEGLLFVTMLPMHKENEEHCLMFAIRGLEILSEVYSECCI